LQNEFFSKDRFCTAPLTSILVFHPKIVDDMKQQQLNLDFDIHTQVVLTDTKLDLIKQFAFAQPHPNIKP